MLCHAPTWVEAAQLLTQLVGQHGDHSLGQIHAGAPGPGFVVQRRALLYEMGHVCNVDAHYVAGAVVRQGLNGQGIIEVFCCRGVDGEDPAHQLIA